MNVWVVLTQVIFEYSDASRNSRMILGAPRSLDFSFANFPYDFDLADHKDSVFLDIQPSFPILNVLISPTFNLLSGGPQWRNPSKCACLSPDRTGCSVGSQ